MKPLTFAVVVSALLFAQSLVGTAAALGPNDDSPPDHDDLGVQLADMFATMADVLASRQDQTANESHLGSAESSRRLWTAVFHAPDVSVRGASPFVEGWIIGDD